MGYRVLIMLVLMILVNGCVSTRQNTKRNSDAPVLMKDIYTQNGNAGQRNMDKFIEDNFKQQKTFGYVKPYIPVIKPPVVRKVWIPDHKSLDDAGVLVGGHWEYLMIQGPKWFIEGESTEVHLPVIVPGRPEEISGK